MGRLIEEVMAVEATPLDGEEGLAWGEAAGVNGNAADGRGGRPSHHLTTSRLKDLVESPHAHEL